ncbi:39S ribosomal protein L18, mitochondrial-like [Oppia nitens]|uniref:39S ribosomal protein L18, mitochondrial-like n=1 Tax=Oppia nitens TaxID=1686743 RepID=UPI0023DC2E81|nr:39S ribosomal protein L18, mitochondrial-like [Oppia nitens]
MFQIRPQLISYCRLRHCWQTSHTRFMSSLVNNKRITRLSSDVEVKPEELAIDGNESLLKTRVVNRNPRNLEQLLLQYKPLGFELDLPEKTYYNKISFEVIGKHLMAKIVHNSGRVIVSASTKEAAIKQQLKSSGGITAASALGHILAMRALESGIHQVFVSTQHESDKSIKVKAFIKSLKDNGLVLEEQPFIFYRKHRDL